MVDVTDSKSVPGNRVWVRVPPPAPARRKRHIACDEPFYFINGSSLAHSATPRFRSASASLDSRTGLNAASKVNTSPISGKHFRSKRLKTCGRKCLPNFLYPKFRVRYKRSKTPFSKEIATQPAPLQSEPSVLRKKLTSLTC